MTTNTTNQVWDLAVQFVNSTNRHVFLTGKAGTGKTTFLKHIRENCFKKMAVVAPTGVAAINAGGVTIHSFFQLPIGTYLPGGLLSGVGYHESIYNKNGLLSKVRMNATKRNMLNELELLIIDEISMVRADTMDAIDTLLRFIRKRKDTPFGGLQVLYIGDLFQLPPVVSDSEKNLLEEFYSGHFFFHSKVVQENPPIKLELDTIYRQSDTDFIRILNNIRNNNLEIKDLEILNSYYKPGFKPKEGEAIITLTTHNSKANQINTSELSQLSGTSYTFDAEIEGEINEHAVQADVKLTLKVGAQVMFIRNDNSDDKRYYNGKLATVVRVKADEIVVKFPEEQSELVVKKEVWKNIRYKLDPEKDRIEEEQIGTFQQYPIKLAWAITIHKSQGLTFEKAIIDAGSSFSPGQVYVALSRMRSLDGLILLSKINDHAILSDEDAIDFHKNKAELNETSLLLEKAQKDFLKEYIFRTFKGRRFTESFLEFHSSLNDKKIPLIEEAREMSAKMLDTASNLENVCDKFLKQLEGIFQTSSDALLIFSLKERVLAARTYFINILEKDILSLIDSHYAKMKNKSRVKKYLTDLLVQKAIVRNRIIELDEIVYVLENKDKNQELAEVFASLSEWKKKREIEESKTSKAEDKKPAKAEKGQSHRLSLQLFRDGMSVAQIAEERALAPSTIENHIVSFILTGEVAVSEFVSPQKIEEISKVLNDTEGEASLTTIRNTMGENYSFVEIRAVMNHRNYQENLKKEIL
jgi:nucleoside-triphosphatase THEP1